MVRKRELAIGISILIIATLAFIFGWTNLFTVKDVTVSGSPNATVTNQILNIANIQRGEKLARIEPRNIAARLASSGIDWIETVSISRNWFSRRVDIHLKARIPVAMAGAKYVDSGGVLFTSPIPVTGNLINISSRDDKSRFAGVDFYLSLPSEFRSQVDRVIATSQENFQVLTKGNLRVIWGSNTDISLKFKIYKALLALPENAKIKVMDLSDPTKPSVI